MRLTYSIISFVLIFGFVHSQDSKNDTTTTHASSHSSSAKPQSSSTTAKPPTIKPSTSATHAQSSTQNSTQHTTKTASSTKAPTKPPTVAPSTKAPPTPPPKIPSPEAPLNPWTVTGITDKKNETCILAIFAGQLQINYNHTVTGGEFSTGFNIPNNSMVGHNSHCGAENATQVLELIFSDNMTDGVLTITFKESDSNVFVTDLRLEFNFTKAIFPNYPDTKKYNKRIHLSLEPKQNLFKVPTKKSYFCDADQKVSLNITDSEFEVSSPVLHFTHNKVQAYLGADSTKRVDYGEVQNCVTQTISDVVPIAVGAALAGLVIIVLIAYFVGRRYNRRMAYQSV